MFARKLQLDLRSAGGSLTPAPRAWLDQFFLRDFTGHSAFDETLPTADGLLEASFAVEPAEVQRQFEKWLRGRKMIPPETGLLVTAAPVEGAGR
jgi:hypothetical protein